MKLWLLLSLMTDLAFTKFVSATVLFDESILKLHSNVVAAKILYNGSVHATVHFAVRPT